MTKLDQFYRKAMILDRCKHRFNEAAPISAYNAAWEESYSWLIKKKDNVFALPHDSVVKLKIDALAGIFEKVKAEPDANSDVLASHIDTLVSELQAMAADEEPGEVKNFIDRTIEAFRSVSYNANQGSADELGMGGGGGGPMGDMGGEDMGGEGEGEGENENENEGDDVEDLPSDLGLEPGPDDRDNEEPQK